MSRTALLLGLSCALWACTNGRAQDFFNSGVSARTAAAAGIYTPAPDNAIDALGANPAGLAALTSPVVNLGLSAIFARGSFSNASNSDSPMSSNNGIAPAVAFGTPLGGSRWSIGFGIMPDLLSASRWSYADTPGAGGADYGQRNEKSAILAYRSVIGAGYRVSDKVSVGATIGVNYNANTLEMPYIFQSNPDLRGLKTLLDLHTNGVGLDSSFGITAHPFRRLWIDGAYKTASHITSTGRATGNMGAQFSALGIPFQPDFAYDAQVKVVLPQSASVTARWQASPVLYFNVQTDLVDWKHAFHDLPVALTHGTNSDIDSFLGSSALNDTVPLDWKDQVAFRGSVERLLGERVSVTGGFHHSNNPVPSSTLTPLTAALMQNGLSGGVGYRAGRARFDLAYGFDFTARQSVLNSALVSGEYNGSSVRVGTQAITLTTTFGL